MEEKIKEILGIFLKIPPEQLLPATVIDRSAVSSSILLHRMYAKLAAEGITVKDYQQVRTFGDLLQRTGASNGTVQPAEVYAASGPVNRPAGTAIGIDMEMVSAMPVTADFREDPFYTMNFSATEIAYCILQPDSYASFAGLFAAKEAMVKADNRFKATPFNQLGVQHQPEGRPFHAAFHLSVSHTNGMAVAVAVPVLPPAPATVLTPIAAKTPTGMPAVWLVVLTSLLLSIIALFLIAGKK